MGKDILLGNMGMLFGHKMWKIVILLTNNK